MSFDVAADSYDRFMGRYSMPLAPELVDFAEIGDEEAVLDVGSGPGALTGELVRRLGADAVAAVDPSEPFVAAARARYPGVDVHLAAAEELPFPDGGFDAALAQLVVHFMADPVGGLGEMARVTRLDGVVAACVWDLAGGRAPLSPFWRAARELDPNAPGESGFPGARAGHLRELFEEAGLAEVEEGELSVTVEHASFEEWWEPFTFGVGPAGAYATSLSDDGLHALRERCRSQFPDGAFPLTVAAWAARGVVAAR
jgi:ubiquinone/menaquinone biosynthesis C-methylase UbiE